MNELEHLARLREEIPLESSRAIEDAVLTEVFGPGLRESASGARIGRKARIRGARTVRRWGLRPVIAGTLALAIGAGTAIGIGVFRSSQEDRGVRQVIAWSGRPTAAWPHGQPSYGRASTEAQLIDYATRAAVAAPGRAPKPNEWVVTRVEQAGSSGGGGGYLFGPPDQRKIFLQWHRGDGCAGTETLAFPANLAPAKTVTGKLAVSLNPDAVYGDERDCLPALKGWKSVTYSYLISLPTDPAALESVILKNNPPGGLIPTREAAIFDAIDTLLTDGEPEGVVVPRRLEAAFYQILKRLPGVHFESGTDLAGRNGLGFWMVQEDYLKEEIVIDPLTYHYMGFKDVAIKDHAMTGTDGTRYVKTGHVMGWEALLGSAIVQRPGQLP